MAEEKPTGVQIVHITLSGFIHQRHPYTPIEDISPLTRLVPMQFSVRIGTELEVYSSHFGCAGQIIDVLLARPAGAIEPEAVVLRRISVLHNSGRP